MATEEACDKLWASSKIDRESSAYAYSGRRPEWRTKVSESTATPADSTKATEANTGALHPAAMLMAMTGPSTSKAANVTKNSTPVTQSRPATTSVPDLPPAYEDGYTLYPWRLRSKNVYKRRLWYGDRKIRWDYGVSDENGHKPDTFFVCKRQTTTTFHWRMNSICLGIMRSLESHRKELGRNCHCDLEYIKTGKTCRDTSRLCLWVQGKTAKWVWDAMKEHDKECSCGAFNFSDSRAG